MTQNSSDSFVEAVTKLLQLTQDGSIKWTTCEAPTPRDSQKERNDTAFCTEHLSKRLRIYKHNFQVDEPNPMNIAASQFTLLGFQQKYPYWSGNVVLEVIDDHQNTIWPFPSSNATADLLRAVRFQVAGIAGFMKDLLGESAQNGA